MAEVTAGRIWTIGVAALFGVAALAVEAAQVENTPVTWTELAHSTVNGSELKKTGGCDGCADAGAASAQVIAAGDGYVEFTVGEDGTFWVAGLAHGHDGKAIADIDFGFRFNGGGQADILENGVYAGGDTAYAPGDTFRIAVVNHRVHYSRNGARLKESEKTPQYPLRLDVTLGTAGASVRDARMVTFGGGSH